MKKGPLNFLSRKSPSLFDTNIKIKDMDNVELVLESSAIPESGTASVRARPTVKHHASSSDSFQGFAVPTPKVPLLPADNGPKTNGLVAEDQLSIGSVISVPDHVEGEIFVPPPPSVAPPPPPGTFIPPPPDFMGDLNSLDLASLQPPSMPAPKPTFVTPPQEDVDLTYLKPPPMAPPKPPSTCSSGSGSSMSISRPPAAQIPEHPKFAPPQPPLEKQPKTHKTPPPKPIRLSSVSNLDGPPQTPAPPPPAHKPTLSTFNPQNTAKLYDIPKTTLLGVYVDQDTRPKQVLLLEDYGSVNPVPVPVKVDGKAQEVVTPPKPPPKDVQELKKNIEIPKPSQSPQAELNKEAKTETVQPQSETSKPPHSPQPHKVTSVQIKSETNKDRLNGPPCQSRSFSPLLDHKLRNLKANETNGTREGHAASPLALLKAAKERDRHRTTHSLSRESSIKKSEQPSANIHPSDSSPNCFTVIPRSGYSSSLTPREESLEESTASVQPVEHVQTTQTSENLNSSALAKDRIASSSPALGRITEVSSSTVSNLAEQKQSMEQNHSTSAAVQIANLKEEFNMPLLPPPPEFDDLDELIEPPPDICPPDPPAKKSATPPISHLPPASASTPPPNHTPPPPPPPPPPKVPLPQIEVKPKPQVQAKPKMAPTQPPAALSPSQATLLSILQKKMLEMDQKMAPAKEAEPTSYDWGTTLSDEDNKVPVVPRASPQTKNYPAANKVATLDMRELESKVTKKYQEGSQVKTSPSNGPHFKHQYGKTFTIRPGSKQPITPVSKDDS